VNQFDPGVQLPSVKDFASASIGIAPPPAVVPQVTQQELNRYQTLKDAAGLRQDYNQAIQAYNETVNNLHQLLGTIWDTAQKYNNQTGQPIPGFEMSKFITINIPKLGVDNNIDVGFTTTSAGVMNYQASMGKRWR